MTRSVILGLILSVVFGFAIIGAVEFSGNIRILYRQYGPKTAEEKKAQILNEIPIFCDTDDDAEGTADYLGYVVGPAAENGCFYIRRKTKFEKIEKRET